MTALNLASWIAWAVLVVEAVALGFIGFWFSRWSLRLFSAATGFILVIAVTRFGFDHPEYHPADLVDSFLSGVDEVTVALLHPLWPGHEVPAPGVAGRWIIAAALLLGYRQLEAWSLRWQAPELDLSAVGNGPPAPGESAPPEPAGLARDQAALADLRTPAQFHAHLAAELRFRLPTMTVRTPAILPGGTRANALASIAEASGVSGAGMLSAAFRLASVFWPSPRLVRVRTWVEPGALAAGLWRVNGWGTVGSRITVLLEDVKSGLPVATSTVTGQNFDEAASMVAGYIARQVFALDRSVPGYCYGMADGRDLGALQLARLQRVYAECPRDMADSRDAQIDILTQWTGSARTAGIVRYELAQLLALQQQHLESLRLHALNRELSPRFYRGRYRFAMSLEMIANPRHYLPRKQATREVLGEILEVLARCGLAAAPLDIAGELEEVEVAGPSGQIETCLRVSARLRAELLRIAAADLRDLRRQLTLWGVVRDAMFRRDERAVWLPHWRTRHRKAFRDGVCVAELLVAVRRRLLEPGDVNPGWLNRTRFRLHLQRATGITSFFAGDTRLIGTVLDRPDSQWWTTQASAATRTRARASFPVRWLPWQRRSESWQAAYNTACLHAALADAATARLLAREERLAVTALTEAAEADIADAAGASPVLRDAALTRERITEAALLGAVAADRKVLGDLEERVIVSLRSAVANPQAELERPSDWIDSDPDFHFMGQYPGVFAAFEHFLLDQKRQDYPVSFLNGECRVPHTAPLSPPAAAARLARATSPILSPVPGQPALGT